MVMSRKKGFKHSNSTRNKIRAKALIRKHSAETKQKIRAKRAKQIITPKMLKGLEFGRGKNSPLYKGGISKTKKYALFMARERNIKKMNNGSLTALVSGDIISGGIYDIMYDGTQFQIKALAEDIGEIPSQMIGKKNTQIIKY